MFCKNEKCGIKVDREGDLCEMCQKCNVRHKCEEYKIKLIRYSTCYKCEELNKIVCVCGGKRKGFHRLCEYCIKYTKSCFSCSGRVSIHSDYIKHCNTCILNSHICSYIDCVEERYGNYCCKKHCCQNEGCLNIISQKKENVKFCDMCICIGYECDNKKLQGSIYCDFDDCIMNKMKCKFENCKKSSIENSRFCKKHKCSLCPNDIASKHTKFCKEHKCSRCYEQRYKSSGQSKKHCLRHLCIVNDCEEDQYLSHFECERHKIPTVCGNWHKHGCYNNCVMMCCARRMNMNPLLKKIRANEDLFKLSDFRKWENLDMNLLLKKMYANEDLSRFSNFFKKTSTILLYKLKLQRVPKDIRRIIFYKFLEETIIHYFSEECYFCASVCRRDCTADGSDIREWPGNINCKKHYCNVPGCGMVKYKHKSDKYKDNKYCKKHKCGECKELVFKDKKFCNKHLCPLCRTNSCTGNKRFCKGCRCNKYYLSENGKGNRRCDSPKHFGSKFCIDHQTP